MFVDGVILSKWPHITKLFGYAYILVIIFNSENIRTKDQCLSLLYACIIIISHQEYSYIKNSYTIYTKP